MQRSLLLAFMAILVSGTIKSQSQVNPGGVQGSSLWYNLEDDSSVLGNYHTFDLLDFESFVAENPDVLSSATTYFFVLQPSFNRANGSPFMTLGGIEIFDDRLEYNGITKHVSFDRNEPRLLALVVPSQQSYGRRRLSTVAVHDSDLFTVAEVLVYPERLNRYQIHKVNSYLALKYSISITRNSDSRWRHYHRADSSLYWSSAIDNFFDQRVLGLGYSGNERFNQTQTSTSSGEMLLLSLDTIKPLGEMPDVRVGEDAFIVFSERLPQSSAELACPSDIPVKSPLSNWKFVLHQWNSGAETIRIKHERLKGPLPDSLFLWDGSNAWYLPITTSDSSSVEYTVDIGLLENNTHYFFIQRSDYNCPEFQTTVDPATLKLEVFVDDNVANEWMLETTGLRTGITTTESFTAEIAWRQLEGGQYLVRVLDSDGNEIGTNVVMVNEENISTNLEIINPNILLFPNPVSAGQPARLVTSDLPGDGPVQIVINDSYGKILFNETLDYYSGIETMLTFPTVGHYQVTVKQGQTSYSLKAIVLQ